MLYLVKYEISGITNQCGTIVFSQDEAVQFAKQIAGTALAHLGDHVFFNEWYNLDGDQIVDTSTLLDFNDTKELINIFSQISELLKVEREGYLDLYEYTDIFQLIDEQDVRSWGSKSLISRIDDARKTYYQLINDINDEWN